MGKLLAGPSITRRGALLKPSCVLVFAVGWGRQEHHSLSPTEHARVELVQLAVWSLCIGCLVFCLSHPPTLSCGAA